MTTPNPILDTALELHDAGYSVLPIRADGTKSPAVAWKPYTQQRATLAQVHAWFDQPGYDLAVVQGAVSGGAELTELEGRAVSELATLRALAVDTGLGDLWSRIVTGWTETSPSGGFHFHARLDGAPVPGNTKLAKAEDRLVLAETRGEGATSSSPPPPTTTPAAPGCACPAAPPPPRS
ncbi:bifunctional DNA primase/polymerase [Litorihabitans aurantiacus]|uniref:DNA primase/polymerase bifunctional N-terminal domain-containing protein n=1 Tax=Litorihabitans aurantiacus TaxID=1930061 RepID=A0AA38CP05_9MICO|nr:bifunctional DNA primase/polymerase [Litorihabitans aurantiacus]GMA31583.1 hypothetical protein GCM10025875_15750 [Litorihabitans aurantiacus]